MKSPVIFSSIYPGSGKIRYVVREQIYIVDGVYNTSLTQTNLKQPSIFHLIVRKSDCQIY